MSPCILVTLAEFLKATENSILADLDLRNGPMQEVGLVRGFPRGALTIAVYAVRPHPYHAIDGQTAYLMMTHHTKAHRGFLAFERTGKFEASGAFSIAEPGIWAGQSMPVDEIRLLGRLLAEMETAGLQTVPQRSGSDTALVICPIKIAYSIRFL